MSQIWNSIVVGLWSHPNMKRWTSECGQNGVILAYSVITTRIQDYIDAKQQL